MFKSKWQKKYELAMEMIESWRQFHEETIERISDNQHLVEIHTAQKIALSDVLKDMERIKES